MQNLQFSTIYYLFFLLILASSCNRQNPTQMPKDNNSESIISPSEPSVIKGSKDINFDQGIYCGFLDSKGILWFGSNGGGLYRYDASPTNRQGASFTHFTEEDGLCNNKVCTITEDQEGNLWFGTAKGLCRYDRKTFTTIAIPQSDTSSIWLDKVYPVINPNQVMSILQDKNGFFWIGTNGAGVYHYDGNTFTQHLSNVGKVYEDSLQHNIVLSITEDLSGNIWFTSLSHAGVSRYDGAKFTHFKTENGLSDNFVRTSFCDKAGNIWIGTHGNRNGGLDRFDGKTFTNFRKTDDGLSQNNVMWIFEDQSGLFWLGGGRDNLCTFDGKTFKEFTTKEGQKFDIVLCILEDATGNIWFGGMHGLWKFDGETVIDMT